MTHVTYLKVPALAAIRPGPDWRERAIDGLPPEVRVWEDDSGLQIVLSAGECPHEGAPLHCTVSRPDDQENRWPYLWEEQRVRETFLAPAGIRTVRRRPIDEEGHRRVAYCCVARETIA